MNFTSPLRNLQFSFYFKIPAETFKIPEKSHFYKSLLFFFLGRVAAIYRGVRVRNAIIPFSRNLTISKNTYTDPEVVEESLLSIARGRMKLRDYTKKRTYCEGKILKLIELFACELLNS